MSQLSTQSMSNSWMDVGSSRQSCANNVVWYKPKNCSFHICLFFLRLFWFLLGNFKPVSAARWSEPKSN
jgi:hypothetical protein